MTAMRARLSISAFVLNRALRSSLALCAVASAPSWIPDVALAQALPERATPASSPYVGPPKGALGYRGILGAEVNGTGFNNTGRGFGITGQASSQNARDAQSPPSTAARNASKRGHRPAGLLRGSDTPTPWDAPPSWQNDSIYGDPWNSPTDVYAWDATGKGVNAAPRSKLGGRHDSTSGQSRARTSMAGYP
jgi:hypothetical protein